MFVGSETVNPRAVSIDMENSWAAQPRFTSTLTNFDDMARFQQKQMQEKEQKLLQLYDKQQQRAYQVVQRGSAGSTGSISQQHSVTKTTTVTQTTGTNQGGKVRQMFDERRQTTVKGIDRSYPLEPLENKSKKQIVTSNGNVPSKPHQHGTVTRQIVTVRRTARSDVNSNVNGGKPVVSYHEEVSRESFGDDNEFGNENYNDKYLDENDRSSNHNGVHIEEILDDDTIGRNRMLAKIHLMEYDKNLKHRVNNDLDNEQFPEDLMVDVPDKLPRKSIAKKLSQAEARLERFKNANAKRNTNNITTTSRPEPRKRSEPMFPSSKTNSRNSTVKSKTPVIGKARPSPSSAKKPPPITDARIESPESLPRKISTSTSTSTSKTVERVESISPAKLVKPALEEGILAGIEPVKISETKPIETTEFAIKSSGPSSRVQKSPSPDPASRKTTNSNSKPLTRRSFPPSPSKSPDGVKRHGSANAKSPEPRTSKVSSQGAPRSQEAVSKGSHRTKIIETLDSESLSKSEPEIEEMKSSTVSQTSVKKEVKIHVDDSDGDTTKEKEIEQSQKGVTRKYSTERESINQNQRQRSPTASPSPRPPSALSTASSTTSSTRGATHSADNQTRRMATKAKNPTRSPGSTTKSRPSGAPSAKSGGPNAISSDSLTPCKICGRRFAQDRISLHEKICTKTGQKKRKQFDAGLHRVQGTELEAFVKKGPGGKQAELRGKAKKPEAKAKSNWRRKHEDFINAIRSAKQVQAHLAAGGKLSDLPPPPASDTSDYIQCPHCGRKFNQGAAERHIPKCATMMHNKPNPRAPPKPKR